MRRRRRRIPLARLWESQGTGHGVTAVFMFRGETRHDRLSWLMIVLGVSAELAARAERPGATRLVVSLPRRIERCPIEAIRGPGAAGRHPTWGVTVGQHSGPTAAVGRSCDRGPRHRNLRRLDLVDMHNAPSSACGFGRFLRWVLPGHGAMSYERGLERAWPRRYLPNLN
jgi:hypothetical protein